MTEATDTPPRYTLSQRVLHWVTAVLVLFMLVTGMMYFLEIADGPAIRAHQVAGQALIVVLAMRILTRVRHRPAPTSHPKWERMLAHGTHLALYAALIVFVATGYVAASGMLRNELLFPLPASIALAPYAETLLEVHYRMKFVLLALFALHIAGVLKHAYIDKERPVRAMSLLHSKGS